MALALSPRLLRRGLELFAVISLLGVGGLLLYGDNFHAFWSALFSLRLQWLVVGLALASMDWFGGGTGLGGLARHGPPGGRWRDMGISGGRGAGPLRGQFSRLLVGVVPPPAPMACRRARARLDGLGRRRDAAVGDGAPRAPGGALAGHGDLGRDECVGGVSDPVSERRRADDDVDDDAGGGHAS